MHSSQNEARPIRVLLLSTDLQRGGLPLRLAKLALRLRGAGIEPIVGCLAPPGPLSHDLAQQGLTTFACQAAGPLDVTCLLRLARYVKQFDPDLIHASLFHANLAARLVGRMDRARPIVTSTVTIEIERPFHRALEALTWRMSDLHVANSEAVAAHLRSELGMDDARMVVIPNGIDLVEINAVSPAARSSFGLDDRTPLIVWAGRMDPVKNLLTLVEVVALVRARRPVQALLLGDGPERERIEREITARGLTKVIQTPGWSSEVSSWLKTADLLFFPSLTEGCPNVVLEAMACKCPIVASDIPSCRELIRSGIDGALVAPRDVEGAVEAVTKLLDDRETARCYADSAHGRIVESHDLSAAVGRTVGLYRRLLAASD